MVAHGYVRFTADVDLVLDMDEGNLRRAVVAFEALGYRPRAPVPFGEFAEAPRRAAWVHDKGLTVFSLYSPAHPATEVDLFAESPFDFSAAYPRAARMEVAPGLMATFAGLDDLIALKKRAGRPQDAIDVQQLETLRSEPPE